MDARPFWLRHRPADRSKIGADGTAGPDRLLEPKAGGALGWKHLGQFGQADALLLEPSRSLARMWHSMWHTSASFMDVHELNAL